MDEAYRQKITLGNCETLKMNKLCIHNSYNIEVSQSPNLSII
jgi:hypothetical protein